MKTYLIFWDGRFELAENPGPATSKHSTTDSTIKGTSAGRPFVTGNIGMGVAVGVDSLTGKIVAGKETVAITEGGTLVWVAITTFLMTNFCFSYMSVVGKLFSFLIS